MNFHYYSKVLYVIYYSYELKLIFVFAYRSTNFLSLNSNNITAEQFKYYLDCSVTLSPCGLKNEHYLSCTMSLSVTALPRRSSCTFSCVLIRRRACKYTLTYLQPWVLHPLLALFNIFLHSKPVL